MICIDCGKDAKKVKPAIVRADGTIGYVCWPCWTEWAPVMHPKNHDCPHCVWSRDYALRN